MVSVQNADPKKIYLEIVSGMSLRSQSLYRGGGGGGSGSGGGGGGGGGGNPPHNPGQSIGSCTGSMGMGCITQ